MFYTIHRWLLAAKLMNALKVCGCAGWFGRKSLVVTLCTCFAKQTLLLTNYCWITLKPLIIFLEPITLSYDRLMIYLILVLLKGWKRIMFAYLDLNMMTRLLISMVTNFIVEYLLLSNINSFNLSIASRLPLLLKEHC